MDELQKLIQEQLPDFVIGVEEEKGIVQVRVDLGSLYCVFNNLEEPVEKTAGHVVYQIKSRLGALSGYYDKWMEELEVIASILDEQKDK